MPVNTQFIYIDSITAIDPSKVTVYDLNKRYIDSYGNMYGLKYNRDTKKIEIIRLVRTSTQHARMIAQRMHQDKVKPGSSRVMPIETEPAAQEQHFETEVLPEDKDEIIPDLYVSERFNELPHFKERLKGLIRNIASSNVNSREHREVSTVLDESIRNLEMDGIQRVDKLISLYRELTEYPRSINYYIGRIDNKGREILNAMHADDAKMKWVLYSEMLVTSRELYGGVDRILVAMLKNLESAAENKEHKLNATERQFFNDAKVTIDNTRGEIKALFDKFTRFEEYIYNRDNFV